VKVKEKEKREEGWGGPLIIVLQESQRMRGEWVGGSFADA